MLAAATTILFADLSCTLRLFCLTFPSVHLCVILRFLNGQGGVSFPTLALCHAAATATVHIAVHKHIFVVIASEILFFQEDFILPKMGVSLSDIWWLFATN